MRLKVSIAFLDGVALKDAIHKVVMNEVVDRFPIYENMNSEKITEVQTDRAEVYDTLWDAAEDCIKQLRLKTFMEVEYSEDLKTAKVVGFE